MTKGMPKPRPPDLPRSLVLLALAALLPIVLFAILSATSSLRQQRDALERDLETQAQRLSQQVDRQIDGTVDPRAFAETARRIQAEQPLWRILTLIDRQGIRIADSLGSPPQPVVEPQSLQRVFGTGAATVGDVATGPRGVPALPVRAPVSRGGEIRYVLTAVISTEAIRDLVLQTQLPAGWIAAVLDREGRIVARSAGGPDLVGKASEPAQDAMRRGGNGLYTVTSLEGTPMVASYRVSPATGWSAHVGLPRERFEAPLQRSTRLTAAGGLASLAIAALFGWLLLRELRARRKDRLALEQAQRMESLGRLTGGIAHDFNNLLTVVLGNLEIIEMRSRGTGLERSLQAIRRAADRGAQLTRELLAFARSGNAQPSLVDLNERVRGFLGMLRQSLPPEVAIDLDLQENLPAVSVDPVHLYLVMPGALDGIGLAREAQRSHPSLKILLISGYNDSAAEARSLGLTILRKPFELGALADAIRAAGGEARAQAG
jgi:hypothetical protein